MKCPNCDLIEKDEAFGQPPTCPKCGAIYEKALRVRQLKELHAKKLKAAAEKKAEEQRARERQAQQREAERQESVTRPSISSSISAGIAEARAERQIAEEAAAKREVVITDIRMPFWSMVVFMVKWAIAAIPAIIILIVIFSVIQAIPVAISTYEMYRSSSSSAKASDYTLGRSTTGSTVRPSTETILSMIKGASSNPSKPQVIQRDPYTIFLTTEKNATGRWRAGLVHEVLSPSLMTGFIVVTDCGDQYGIIEYSAPDEIPALVAAGK